MAIRDLNKQLSEMPAINVQITAAVEVIQAKIPEAVVAAPPEIIQTMQKDEAEAIFNKKKYEEFIAKIKAKDCEKVVVSNYCCDIVLGAA